MKIICDKQNTPEWDAARLKRLTASAMGHILARPGTKSHDNYVMELVMDHEGLPQFDDNAPWFDAGKQWEAWARGWYAWKTGTDVRETGFVVHDQYDFIGCSPDGIIDNAVDVTEINGEFEFVGGEPIGLIEIKFRKILHTFHQAITKPITPAIYNQIQMQLWVCDLPWCDLVNFWREDSMDLERGHIQRVERDNARISKIEEMCLRTQAEVLNMVMTREKRQGAKMMS
jgi:hypothetical protein